MVIRFVHSASLLLSLFHFALEHGAHPLHGHAMHEVLFGDRNRRSIVE